MAESAPSGIPHDGDLDTTALPDVLEQLTQAGVTGTLAINREGEVKAIFFQKGEPVFATSTVRSDRLGEVLLRHGIISRSAHEATTRAMQQSGKREGETMVDMGVLTPKGLFEGLKLQVEEIIISAFLWDHGQFKFMEGRLPSHVVPLPISLEQLLPKVMHRLESA